MTLQAAIYCRISQDSTGDGLGVKRQESDCRAFCERRGWSVADVLVENDTSAYGKKRRPLYDQLVERIDAGNYDAVVVWHPDRLHRSPIELESFIDLVERTRLTVATVTAGDYDLATPEGRLTARIVGSVARKESEDKSRRLKRKHVELAEHGKLSGGGRRPFGFEADRLTVRQAEADEIRAAARRVLAGDSVRSIALDWNDRNVASVTGAAWSPTTIKRLLMSGRISGQREHHGQLVGRAEWQPIIDPDDTLRLRSLLSNAARATGATSARTYLLSGFVFCAGCGSRMTARPVRRKGIRYRRYVCSVDRGGCGRCGIGAEPLENLITEYVLAAFDTPKLAKKVAARKSRKKADPGDEVKRLEERQSELAEMYAAGEVGRREWATARTSIDDRLASARQAVATATVADTQTRFVGRGDVLRDEWPSMTLDRQRAVIAAVVERVEIALTTKAANYFDEGRVAVRWVK